MSGAGSLIALGQAQHPLPPMPTRAQILSDDSRQVFQGVAYQSQQYGPIQCFGPELSSLDLLQDRVAYYTANRQAGSNICQMSIAGETYVSGSFTYPVPGPGMRWLNDLPGWVDRVYEILTVGGFKAMQLMSFGDGLTGPDNPYGQATLMRWLPTIVKALKFSKYGNLAKGFTVWMPGYDGVVWVWTPQQILDFANVIRSIEPDAIIGFENPAGVLGPYGEGREQFDGPLQVFDVFLQEYAYQPFDNKDQIWQIDARFQGPTYVRPADQPANDDPGAPFAVSILSAGTPRGDYFWRPWEGFTYGWVRAIVNLASIAEQGHYIFTAGAINYGWPEFAQAA